VKRGSDDSPFEARAREAKRRKNEEAILREELKEKLRGALDTIKDMCPMCMVFREHPGNTARHPAVKCQTLRFYARGGPIDIKKAIRYWVKGICACCHLPQLPGFHDVGDEGLSASQTCQFRDIVHPLIYAIWMHEDIVSYARDDFGESWSEWEDFVQWLSVVHPPLNESNLVRLFLWFFDSIWFSGRLFE